MNNKAKLLLGVIIGSLIIIGSIKTALSILKEEAVENYLTISKLNAKSFSKELNQDLTNIEQTIVNIKSIMNLYDMNININKRLKEILKNYPQIRSINILQNNKILYSSNTLNTDIILNNSNFYPKPIFDDNILKVSTPWIGRDFVSGNDIYSYEDKIDSKDSFFIPIAKNIDTNKGVYEIIINLNSDYFINRFLSNMDSKEIIFELIRLDGILLLSTQDSNRIGRSVKELEILNNSIEKNIYTTIDTIDEKKYILTYILTDNYPIALAVKLDYEKSLLSWNKKQYDFFIITTIIVISSILLALLFFYLYNKHKDEEIKLHKQQLKDKEKFRLLFQDSHFLSALIRSDGKIIEMNNLALNFLGINKVEMADEYFWNLNCWADNEKKRIKELISQNQDSKVEDEIVAYDLNKNRKIIDFSLTSILFEDEKLLLAIGLDITQKKEREKKLKQAYTVFDNTRDGIMITDIQSNIVDVNKAFEKITGYKKEEAITKNTRVLKSNIHTKQFYEKMWTKILTEGYWDGEITNTKKNGEQFVEWLTIDTIKNESGEVINYIGVFSDITEQKKREKLLKEKDDALYQQSKMAAMGEMIGNIAHQWRQPLSMISSASTGLLVQKSIGVSDENNEKEVLTKINKSAQYLSQTIEDFRNFLKVDKKLKLFQVSKAIEESLSLSNINNSDKHITIIKNLDNEINAYGIKNEFIQVMMNIFKNAIDAFNTSSESKFIFIDLYTKNQTIYIKIKDNAGGIQEDIISRIFEPYFTTKHQSQGTGIGLYMSEEIIKNHMKGVLYAKNEEYQYEDKNQKGATFIIKLPFK